MSLKFPDNFVWGVATASYQIEGATDEDGRGESIWDRFAATPGKTHNGDSGAVADDHYHRYPEDIALMKDLGVKAYRLSVAWPRIFPEGKGRVNELGIAFYDRLIDELLKNDITPYVTLYHWDLPQILEDDGGWLNRATSDYFADYADIVSRALGDRVKHWMTFNEPLCICWISYGEGRHAPGKVDPSFRDPAIATHTVYLGHGKAVPILRANSKDCKVGIVLNMSHVYANTSSDEDRAAVLQQDAVINRWFADPVLKGEYPQEVLRKLGGVPKIEPGDMEIIHQPLDFVGINNYFRSVVQGGGDPNSVFPIEVRVPNADRTEMDWEIYPQGLYDLLMRVTYDYHPKEILITENGCAMPDQVTPDGNVHDPRRVKYLHDHFEAAHRAIMAGAPLNGYFVWSMMDNFEWAYGYAKRFGITYVDYETQKRIPKDSYHFYQGVIKSGSL
ncbi:MAG: beta-glucosidase [Anaerolineae bacterium]|nr:beta-glucosidase [Anaerolineae bacterium]